MSIWSDTANLLDKDRYDPLGWAARRLAPREPARLAGVPNPQRDDPLPHFDPDAAEKRAIGATAWGSVYGAEPRTPEELEVASGVDRRIPDAPRTWGEPTTIPTLGSYATAPGGIAIAHGTPPPVRDIAPRVPFADAAGESFADTARRGAQARALAEREGLTTADMDYIRSYGRRAFDERNARFSAPATRADYLARQAGNLSVSVAERRAAQDELARLDRLAADERRREDWAAEQAALLGRARIAASAPVSFGAGAGALPNAQGGWNYVTLPPGTTGGAADNSWRTEVARIEQETQLRVKELENQGLDRRQAQEIAARERVQKLQNEGNLSVAQAQAQGRTDAATATAQGRVDAAAATAEGRVKAAGIRADAQKYASDNTYKAAADASAARVEAAKAAGLSEQQVAQIRAESQERIAKLSQDGALARAGIQADAQKYISDNAYAARADAAAAAVEAAMATADARVSAERVRAEGARLLAAENPWVALGGGVMGNRQTGDQAGRPNATAAAAKPQIFKMKGADGTERLVRPREDGAGVEVLFEDPDAALVIAEQEVRNLESDKLRYGRTTAQREGYDERIAEAKARLAALREARRSAPDYEGPTGQAPTNDAADGWAAFGGIVR